MALNVDTLIATAREQTGLTDLGDERIMEGFHVLVDSINAEAKLTERGEASTGASIVKALVNRLKVEDYIKQNPDVLEKPIEKPMFVFGLPRTGTTLVINLLAADPARRPFLRYESYAAVPPPVHADKLTDPRYIEEAARLEMSIKYAPHISAMHHEDADSPSECQFAMAPSLCSQLFDSQLHIPSYHKWFMATSYRPAFDFHKRLMQVLQAGTPGRWTFKNPWHPLFLEDLTAVYPDAQLVMTHRDPVATVGSACSLVQAVRVMMSNDARPEDAAEVLLDTFDAMIARSDAYRAKHGAHSIHDVQYAAMMADPIGEMKKLYSHFDEPLTAEAEAAMQAYLANNQQGKHGKHSYALEDYGLTKDGIRAHFRDYVERYGIESK